MLGERMGTLVPAFNYIASEKLVSGILCTETNFFLPLFEVFIWKNLKVQQSVNQLLTMFIFFARIWFGE